MNKARQYYSELGYARILLLKSKKILFLSMQLTNLSDILYDDVRL